MSVSADTTGGFRAWQTAATTASAIRCGLPLRNLFMCATSLSNQATAALCSATLFWLLHHDALSAWHVYVAGTYHALCVASLLHASACCCVQRCVPRVGSVHSAACCCVQRCATRWLCPQCCLINWDAYACLHPAPPGAISSVANGVQWPCFAATTSLLVDDKQRVRVAALSEVSESVCMCKYVAALYEVSESVCVCMLSFQQVRVVGTGVVGTGVVGTGVVGTCLCEKKRRFDYCRGLCSSTEASLLPSACAFSFTALRAVA